MVAHNGDRPWADLLARRMADLPVGIVWPRDADEAVGMAADGSIHVAVLDNSLPRTGGLDALRRMRRSGLQVPALLVCDEADRRLMVDAIQLDVYSVVTAADGRDFLTPMVVRLARRVYRVEWPELEWMN